jgi:hypothetical protein
MAASNFLKTIAGAVSTSNGENKFLFRKANVRQKYARRGALRAVPVRDSHGGVQVRSSGRPLFVSRTTPADLHTANSVDCES